MRHPSTFPIVDAILGHQARFAQFDFRETATGAGMQKMAFHHDAALPSRVTREQYDPPDYVCTIHYLCDVLDESSPAFAVVSPAAGGDNSSPPRSSTFPSVVCPKPVCGQHISCFSVYFQNLDDGIFQKTKRCVCSAGAGNAQEAHAGRGEGEHGR